jgi:hypothetical protein
MRLNFKFGLELIGGKKCDNNQDPSLPMENKNFEPTFVGEPLSVGFWAAISYGHHTSLIPLRKRTENEKKSSNDKLGFDSHQYTHEILIPHLLPFYMLKMG